jgi:hypothetical protein
MHGFVVLVVAVAVAGCGFEGEVDQPFGEDASGGGLVGVITSIDGSEPAIFAAIDPLTLRARRSGVALGEYHDAWTLSPDGSQAAFGISAPAAASGGRVGIRIVDVDGMRVSRDVSTGIAAQALGWLAPRRLAALLQSGEIVVVDPRTGDILGRQSVGPFTLQCTPQPSAVTPQGLVLLLASSGGVSTRLVMVNGQGRVRTVSLRRIAVDGNCGRGGLAIDQAGDRAFAVGRGSLVAEVDLRAMRVAYRRPAEAPLRSATRRSALWLGDGRLAVSGRRRSETPAGVAVIDTSTWNSRDIDTSGGAARSTDGTLLVYDGKVDSLTTPGIGLRAYRPDGRPRFRVLEGQKVWNVEVVAHRAYARTSTGLHVVNVRSGEVTGELPALGSLTEVVTRAGG